MATFAEALDAGDSQARAYSRKVWQMNAGVLHRFADGLHMCSLKLSRRWDMQAEVLGLTRVRLTFRPLADLTNSAIPQQLAAAPPVTLVSVQHEWLHYLGHSTCCPCCRVCHAVLSCPAYSCEEVPWVSQGMPVGVLLVRLCSAALQTGGELTHPAVRLTIGKQVLQPIHTCPRALVNTRLLPS